MRERLTQATGEQGGPSSFSSNAAAVEGAPPPLLTGRTFSERMSELNDLRREADNAPGAPRGGAVHSYIAVDDGAGGQMLQRVDPFDGDQAGLQNYAVGKAPNPDRNPSLGRNSIASSRFHRGRTPNT